MSVDSLAVRLHVSLPSAWQRVEADEFADFVGHRANTVAGEEVAELPLPLCPDFVATLFVVIEKDDGLLERIVMASMVVDIFTTDSLPKPMPAQWFEPMLQSGVGPRKDLVADFWSRTYAVASADGVAAALVTFSTPNLPLVDELEPTFRDIVGNMTLS